jgi:hypothetical protein
MPCPARWRCQRLGRQWRSWTTRRGWAGALHVGLSSGGVYVPGSRRYDNPAAYLFKPAQWDEHRTEFCRLVGKSSDASEVLAHISPARSSAVNYYGSITVNYEREFAQLDENRTLEVVP